MPRLGLALALALPVALAAQAPSSKPALLVLAKSDLTLSIVDPATLKVLGTVPSGPDPHEVVASPDGRTAYISNYGGGSLDTITVVDLVGRKALAPILLGALRGPHGLMFAAGRLWFTAEGAKVVGSYDPLSKTIDLVIGTGQNGTHMVVASEDGGRVITSNIGSASISIFERTAGRGRAGGPPPPAGGRGTGAPGNWNGVVIPAGRGVEGFDVSPDGRELWAANAQDGTITVIDVAGRKVTDTLQAGVNGANRLKFTPDGRHVLVSTLSGPDLFVFDTASRKEAKRVAVGTGAAGLQLQPDGARAYVACTPDSYVAVVDLKSLSVIGKIEAGRNPDGLAWASIP
jgi:YVTN family beta-propeller protein